MTVWLTLAEFLSASLTSLCPVVAPSSLSPFSLAPFRESELERGMNMGLPAPPSSALLAAWQKCASILRMESSTTEWREGQPPRCSVLPGSLQCAQFMAGTWSPCLGSGHASGQHWYHRRCWWSGSRSLTLFLLQNREKELSTRPMTKLSQLFLFGHVISHSVAVIYRKTAYKNLTCLS